MKEMIQRIWSEDQGQDIAEYAVMLAVILVLVVGTIRLVGSTPTRFLQRRQLGSVTRAASPGLHFLSR